MALVAGRRRPAPAAAAAAAPPAPRPHRCAGAAAAAAARASSWSAPARPASRTPTWRPTSSPPPAQAAGVDVHVETQGSSGATPLDPAVIRAADAVIFAVDVGVRDQGRFAGKPVIQSGTKRAINEPDVMIREALAAADDPNARRVAGDRGRRRGRGVRGGAARRSRTEIRRWLLTGVSYMIPFVAAGGLLIALGFLLAGYPIAQNDPKTGTQWAKLWVLNNSIFDLPTSTVAHMHGGLAGYLGAICFTIGAAGVRLPRPGAGRLHRLRDRRPARPRPRLRRRRRLADSSAPASSAASSAASSPASRRCGSAAGSCRPASAGLQPVVIIPLLATLISSGLMVIVLGKPLAAALTGLGNWLNSLTGTQAILLGIVLGLMMCFDLGGPVNKAAYVFATTGLTAALSGSGGHQQLVIMATVMAAGMVPPLAMALSTDDPPEAVHRGGAGQRQGRLAARRSRSSPRAPSRSRPPTRCGSSPR